MPKLRKDFLSHNFEGSSFVWTEFKNSQRASLIGLPFVALDAALLPVRALMKAEKSDSKNDKELERLRKSQGWPKPGHTDDDDLFNDYYAWQQRKALEKSQSMQGSRRSESRSNSCARNEGDVRSRSIQGSRQETRTARQNRSRAGTTSTASSQRDFDRRQRNEGHPRCRNPAPPEPPPSRPVPPPVLNPPQLESPREAPRPAAIPTEPRVRLPPNAVDQGRGVDPSIYHHPRIGPPSIVGSRATQMTQSTRYTNLEHDGESSVWLPARSEVIETHPRYRPTGRADSVAPGDSQSQVGYREYRDGSSHRPGSKHSSRSSRASGRRRPAAIGHLPAVREEEMIRLPGPVPPQPPRTIWSYLLDTSLGARTSRDNSIVEAQNPRPANGGYPGNVQYQPQAPTFVPQNGNQMQPPMDHQRYVQGTQYTQPQQSMLPQQVDQYGRPIQNTPGPAQAQMQRPQPRPAQEQGYMQPRHGELPEYGQPQQQQNY